MTLSLLFLASALMLGMRWIVVLFSHSNDDNENGKCNVSVVVPLRGWDATLPKLMSQLVSQKYSGCVEVICVVDKNHSQADQLRSIAGVKCAISAPISCGWEDKNWRLYQGVKQATYETILFLDSDVVIDRDYLHHRMRKHEGHLSYSIPLYTDSCTSSGHFLSSCTNYLNFMLYRFGSQLVSLATAIGPSIVVTAGKDFLLTALESTSGEIADDHALGYWFVKSGYDVHCSSEPVNVGKGDSGWYPNLKQIIRWFSLTHAVRHLLTTRAVLLLSGSALLISIHLLWLAASLILIATGRFSLAIPTFAGGVLLMLFEAALLIVAQRKFCRRASPNSPWCWNHLIYLPLVLSTQWIFWIIACLKRQIIWRGKILHIR